MAVRQINIAGSVTSGPSSGSLQYDWIRPNSTPFWWNLPGAVNQYEFAFAEIVTMFGGNWNSGEGNPASHVLEVKFIGSPQQQWDGASVEFTGEHAAVLWGFDGSEWVKLATIPHFQMGATGPANLKGSTACLYEPGVDGEYQGFRLVANPIRLVLDNNGNPPVPTVYIRFYGSMQPFAELS